MFQNRDNFRSWYDSVLDYELHTNDMERQEAEKEAKLKKSSCELFDAIFKGEVKITFSKYCCSGIIHVLGNNKQCQCHRCRQARGEEVTEESEQISKVESEEATRIFREQQREWVRQNMVQSPSESSKP
jgi:hypothetical protein